jgi:hypothetical protein
MPSIGPKEHERFCILDAWQPLPSARGKGRDHLYFSKQLPGGRVAQTKVSYSRKEYGPSLWHHIWHDQLLLETEQQFWDVLATRKPASRPGAAAPPEGKALTPGWLVQRLIYTAGLRADEVEAMSAQEAADRWHDYQISGH